MTIRLATIIVRINADGPKRLQVEAESIPTLFSATISADIATACADATSQFLKDADMESRQREDNLDLEDE